MGSMEVGTWLPRIRSMSSWVRGWRIPHALAMRFCLGGCRLELRLNWLMITAGKVFELKDVT